MIESTKARPVIDALFVASRLISETLTSAPARMAPPNKPQTVEITTDTNSSIAAAIDDPIKPEMLLIQIDYKVVHKTQKEGRELVKYEATHAVQFKIRSANAVGDWLSPPPDALAVYLAVAHGVARKRAEHTFLDMGLHGVVLPVPTEFSSSASPIQIAVAATAGDV